MGYQWDFNGGLMQDVYNGFLMNLNGIYGALMGDQWDKFYGSSRGSIYGRFSWDLSLRYGG